MDSPRSPSEPNSFFTPDSLGQRTISRADSETPPRLPENLTPTPPEIQPGTISAGIASDQTRTLTAPSEHSSNDVEMLAGYRVVKSLGKGGHGAVYQVKDSFGRAYALKKLHASQLSEQGKIRFYREAEAMAQLDHPNIAPLLHWSVDGESPFFLTRYFESGSLADHLKNFQADPRRSVRVMHQIVMALSYLHERGKIHRDIKPHNIFLDDQGNAYLGDFGLVKEYASGSDVTITGALLGTPAYMSPEQAAGRIHQIGPASDIWSVGVVLYELLVGSRPFKGNCREEVLLCIQTERPESPSKLQPELDPRLQRILGKCLEREPAARYPSSQLLANDLLAWLEDQHVPDRRDGPFRRCRRWLRSHPVSCLSTFICLGLLWAMILSFPPPTQSARVIEATRKDRLDAIRLRLSRGEAVSLLGDLKHPPAPYSMWNRTDLGLVRPTTQPAGLSVESFTTLLVELIDDPGIEEYTFQAKVRLNSHSPGSRCGIYVAGQRIGDAAERSTMLVHVSFSEHFSNPPKLPVAAQQQGLAQVEVLTLTPRADGKQQHWEYRPLGATRRFPVNHGAERQWHVLQAICSKNAITFSMDDQVICTLGRPLDARVWDDFPEAIRPTLLRGISLPVRSSLGFFVMGGSATYQAVELVPRPAP